MLLGENISSGEPTIEVIARGTIGPKHPDSGGEVGACESETKFDWLSERFSRTIRTMARVHI